MNSNVTVPFYECTPEAMAVALREVQSSSAHVVVFRSQGKPAVADLLLSSGRFMVLGDPDASWHFMITSRVVREIQKECERED